MYEQQDNRDLDQNDVSNARYPHESSQHEPITKMDSLFRLFLLCLIGLFSIIAVLYLLFR